MDSSQYLSHSDALNRYVKDMEDELAEQASRKTQPSDIQTLVRESIMLGRAFENILLDTENETDIDSLQEEVNQKVRMLGLTPAKFDLRKLRELAKKVESEE